MKEIDVTKDVMQHVARYERTGISVWIRGFIIAVICIIISCSVVLFMIITDLLSKRAFDLFELFSQDPEIISEFWKEVLFTFWQEIPQQLFVIVFVLIIILVTLIVVTGEKRHIIRKKLKALDKYS